MAADLAESALVREKHLVTLQPSISMNQMQQMRSQHLVDIVALELTEPRPVRGCVERNYDLKNAATRNANKEWWAIIA